MLFLASFMNVYLLLVVITNDVHVSRHEPGWLEGWQAGSLSPSKFII